MTLELPGFLHARASEIVSIDCDAADRRRQWATVLGLMPYRDGDRWCVSTGGDRETAVCGFGDTPELAIWEFEKAMSAKGGTNPTAVNHGSVSLIQMGFWSSEQEPDWPDPIMMMDAQWDQFEKETVTAYLKNGQRLRQYMGHATCRLCGDRVGTWDFSDGTFVWPEGLAHYVAAHTIRPPQRFIDHVKGHEEQVKRMVYSSDWWMAVGRALRGECP